MKNRITETYKLYEDHGIVHLIVHEDSCLEYSEAQEIDRYIKKNLSNKKYLKLFDARSNFEITDNARSFLDSPISKKKIIALAVLIGVNSNQRVIDFFGEMKTRKLPVKLFVNYDEAVSWLNSFNK
jgi:hypothetical protein